MAFMKHLPVLFDTSLDTHHVRTPKHNTSQLTRTNQGTGRVRTVPDASSPSSATHMNQSMHLKASMLNTESFNRNSLSSRNKNRTSQLLSSVYNSSYVEASLHKVQTRRQAKVDVGLLGQTNHTLMDRIGQSDKRALRSKGSEMRIPSSRSPHICSQNVQGHNFPSNESDGTYRVLFEGQQVKVERLEKEKQGLEVLLRLTREDLESYGEQRDSLEECLRLVEELQLKNSRLQSQCTDNERCLRVNKTKLSQIEKQKRDLERVYSLAKKESVKSNKHNQLLLQSSRLIQNSVDESARRSFTKDSESNTFCSLTKSNTITREVQNQTQIQERTVGFQHQIQSLQETLLRSQIEIEKHKANIVETRSQLEEVQRESGSRRSLNLSLTTEVDKLQQEKGELQNNMSRVETERANLGDEKRRLIKDILTLKEEMSILKIQQQEDDNKISSLSHEFQQKQEECSGYSQVLSMLASKLEFLLSKYNLSHNHKDMHHSQIISCLECIEDYVDELKLLKEDVTNEEDEEENQYILNLNTKLKELALENTNLKKLLSQNQLQLEDIELERLRDSLEGTKRTGKKLESIQEECVIEDNSEIERLVMIRRRLTEITVSLVGRREEEIIIKTNDQEEEGVNIDFLMSKIERLISRIKKHVASTNNHTRILLQGAETEIHTLRAIINSNTKSSCFDDQLVTPLQANLQFEMTPLNSSDELFSVYKLKEMFEELLSISAGNGHKSLMIIWKEVKSEMEENSPSKKLVEVLCQLLGEVVQQQKRACDEKREMTLVLSQYLESVKNALDSDEECPSKGVGLDFQQALL